MTREIKFRAWDKKIKKIYPFLKISPKEKMILTDSVIHQNRFFKDIEIMQFTGLKDKKGKEIYEGDILKDNEDYIWICNFRNQRMLHNKTEGWSDIFPTEQEIIGNIYENPKLLEEANE